MTFYDTLPPIDLATLDVLVFERLKSDIEGQTLRDLLGGPERVVRQSAVHRGWPAFPCLTFRPNAITSRADNGRVAGYEWIAHIAPAANPALLPQIIRTLTLAYQARSLWMAQGGAINSVEVTDLGGETELTQPSRLSRSCRVYVYL